MVTSPDYRHVPTSRLSMLAQRLSRVFACTATWNRLVREHGWRRPRFRVHPEQPKIGIRATKPNQIFHYSARRIIPRRLRPVLASSIGRRDSGLDNAG
jgi:hypothetical protein